MSWKYCDCCGKGYIDGASVPDCGCQGLVARGDYCGRCKACFKHCGPLRAKVSELKWEKSNYPTGVYATPRLRGLYPRAVAEVLNTEDDGPLGYYELSRLVFDERVPKNEIWAWDGKTVTKLKLWDWEGIE